MTKRGMWKSKLALAALAGLIVCPSMLGLDPQKVISQYSHQVWAQKDGLPQNTVRSIIQSRDGYIWLATYEGLARFDGVRFTVFDKHSSPALPNPEIISLCQDPKDDAIWIGTSNSVSRYDGHEFKTYTHQDGIPEGYIWAVHVDRNGTLWIGGDQGLVRYKDGRFTKIGIADGLRSVSIRSIYEDRAGVIWVGTTAGLSVFRDGKFQSIDTKEGLSNDIIWAIYEDSAGNLWIGTQAGLDKKLPSGAFEHFKTKDGLGDDYIESILQDHDGNLWVGTYGGGLSRLADGKFTTLTRPQGLSNPSVRALFEDREGSLWVGTNGGLDRLRDSKFVALTSIHGLSDPFARTVFQDKSGTVWVGTAFGLDRWQDGKFTTFRQKDGLSHDYVLSLYQQGTDDLWIGTVKGLNHYVHGHFTHYGREQGLPNDMVRAMTSDAEGNLWLGTPNGLVRFHDEKFTVYDHRLGLSMDYVVALLADRAGNIWVGTDGGGLNRFTDGKFTAYHVADGLSGEEVLALHEDDAGTLWIGTQGGPGGLTRLRDGKFTQYGTTAGMFDDVVFQILDDGHEFWLSSNKGVARVSKQELEDFASGKRKSVSSVSYGMADGMPSNQVNGGSQPAGFRASDGKLWFPTAEGVAIVDPSRMRNNAIPPPVVLEMLVADNREIDLASPDIRIASSTKNLEFHYTGLSFVVPEKVRFRYKLEGFDHDWVEAGNRRVAYYTNVPPGNYTFRVMAANNDGIWSAQDVSTSFYVKPHFYQTPWFYALCAVLTAMLLWLMQRRSRKQLRVREQELTLLHHAMAQQETAEQALVESEAKFRTITETATAAIFIYNGERLLYVNEATEQISGYSRKELLSMNPLDMVAPDYRVQLKKRMEARMAGQRGLERFECIIITKQGKECWLDLSASRYSYFGATAILAMAFDITERKRTERNLRESEAKFRAVCETATQAIYIHDGERLLYANPAAAAISGYTLEELMSMDIWHLTHPDSIAMMQEYLEQRKKGNKPPSRYEYKFISKDGNVHWAELSTTPIQFEGQSAFLVSTFDITERKQAEQLQGALYRIAEKANAAIDLQQFYAAIHSILGELMYAKNFYIALYDSNSGMLTFPYSVDEEDAVRPARKPGKGLTEYILRTERAHLVSPEKFEELVAAGEVESVGAASIDWLGAPLRHQNQTIGALVVQSYSEQIRYTKRDRDILSFVSQQVASAIEHKHDQDAVRQSETRYRSLVESAVYGIYRSSAEGRFLEINRKMVSMMGYDSADQMLQLDMATQVYYDPADRARILAQLHGTRMVEGIEVTWKKKDGKPVSLRLSGRSVSGPTGELESFEMIAEDVTERKLLEEQLRQSQKMDAVGRLAGGVAHDFNNLLTVIKGYSDILLDDFSPVDPKRGALEEIKKSADRAAALTSQLLAFSRRQVTAPKVLDLNTSVRNMEKMLHRLLGADVDLHTKFHSHLGRVKADSGQIEQVIMNLAVNARDAMPRGGKLMIETTNVCLDASFAREFAAGIEAGEYVMITVSDTGCGMSKELQSRIFEPFFTTKELGKGTGLGLSTVYGIIKQSCGHVAVKSEPGVGTTFQVYLPRVDAVAEPMGPERAAQDLDIGSETVLVVEDDEGLRGLVSQILAKRGYKVLQAPDPNTAVEINANHKGPIQLLLTDMVMRQMNGHDLAKKLTASRPGTRVLFMSGYASEVIVHQGILESGVAFLQKPFTTSGLARKVREVLDNRTDIAAASD